MAAAEIFFEHERWGRNLAWSAGFHVAIAASILAYSVIAPGSRGEGWGAGGGGDAMGVTLVSTVPLPEANAKKKSKAETTPTHQKPQPQPEPVEEANNVVPFGQGGPVSGPYGTFSAGGAKGGFGFTGGGGDFGTRFGWYVDTVQQK